MEKAFIPFDEDVPVLHGMTNIRSLDKMLQHDCCLAIDIGFFVFAIRESRGKATFGEDLIPSCLSESAELFIHDIRRHDEIRNELAEALVFLGVNIEYSPKISVGRVHEKCPSKINGVLFGNALISIGDCKA